MSNFAKMESEWLEPDDPPELPDGWWDEDRAREAESLLKMVLMLQEGEWDEGKGMDWWNVVQHPDKSLATLSIAIRAFLEHKLITPEIHQPGYVEG